MIIRDSERGLLLIRQTEHARLCGVMAQAWGNERFEPPRPPEAMRHAAAEHDNGWREWEDDPKLNPQTLRPYSYSDIPVDQHLAIYRRGIERAARQDPYAGLMVSLHGTLLYSRYRSGQPGAAQFLAEQEALRRRLLEQLSGDTRVRPFTEPDVLRHNRDLLFGWDVLSLLICHGSPWQSAVDFPTDYAGGRSKVSVDVSEDRWQLDPFPFQDPLTLSVAAEEISGRSFVDEDVLREARRSGRQRVLAATLASA